ncbi:MAG TPA: hypothetical protein PLM14_13110 [Candidatus Hydrogenedentes bacterium]|nr:hypothetical protein [Candidatus Hydrogenedentota bacterium]
MMLWRWRFSVTANRAVLFCLLAVLAFAPAAAKPEVRVSDAPAYRFEGDTYAVAFYLDGRVDLYARQNGQDLLLGTIGAFEMPACELRSGPLLSLSRFRKTIPPSEMVHVENVATALQSPDSGFPEIYVDYRCEKGALAVLWTLMPQTLHLCFCISPAEGMPRSEGPAMLAFSLAEGAQPAEQIKPARWHQHPQGGVPFQLTAGMADRFTWDKVSLVMANDHGFPALYDSQTQQIYLFTRDRARPWLDNALQANVAFAIGEASPVMTPLTVAIAGRDPLMMRVVSQEPFYLGESCDEPLVAEAQMVQTTTGPQRIDLQYVARDFDGRVIGQESRRYECCSMEVVRAPIELKTDRVGPVYLETVARTDCATVVDYVCLGVLPAREFTDGKESRFGISAYRGGVGAHTELRTEEQLLTLMARLGIRWLRASGDHALAQRMGFFTWYQNSVAGPEAEAYKRGEPSWINESANREDYLAGNLRFVLDHGDLVFEFTNEWNLWGGEGQGLLAEKYTRDWLVPIRRLRDEMAPHVKLAGCVLANGDLAFLDKVYEAGGWDQFELLSFHAAGEPRAPDFDDGITYWSYLATLRRIHEAMLKYGRKELWMTEFYAPCAPNSTVSNNERVAAENIPLMCAMAIAADVRGFMLYCLDDFDGPEEIKTASQVGEPAERESYFGIVRRDWCPKAGLWAYQAAAWYLEGARFLGDVQLPEPWLHGLLFQSRQGRVALLWSRKDGYLSQRPPHPRATHRPPWEEFWTSRTPIELPASDSVVTVVDCVGHARYLTPGADGSVTIELTGAPIYVLGAAIEPCAGQFSEMFKPTVAIGSSEPVQTP